MRLRSIILAIAGCLLAWGAQAQPIQGIYVDGGAGLRMAFPPRATSLEPGVPGTFELRQQLGYDTRLGVGYALGNGWRFELEATLGHGDIGSVASTPYPATASGSVRHLGFMANALFDLDVRSPYVFPYVGFGVGYQSTRLDGFTNTAVGKSGSFSASGSSGAPAGQLIGGLSFPIPNMPGLSVTVDYRVMDILGGGSFHGESTIGLAPGAAPVAGSIKLHDQFTQSVMFGVRYAFDTPPPPGVVARSAAIPGAAAQSYQVAPDGNATALSDRAQTVVRRAALASTRQGTTRIAITGDSSGRRARIVVAALVAEGVPRDAISVRAPGDDPDTSERLVEIVTR